MRRTHQLMLSIEERELESKRFAGDMGESRVSEEEDMYSAEEYKEMERVVRKESGWLVNDVRLQKMCSEMDWSFHAAENRFAGLLKALGVIDELVEAGAKVGDDVFVGDVKVRLKSV
mmetsp:Transcript_15076/g.22446  ORF Transcript_15076/g.22446 Transcript_15076/m.22446 type:complete len:117 (-) Transcript_15076:36-386(-)